MLMITAADVYRLMPMPRCIEVMERAMCAVSNGTAELPSRIIAPLPDGRDYFILMPGHARDLEVYGAKVVSLHPGNAALGRPAVQGFVSLFDRATGAPLALLEGAAITEIRTAAASALATRELARSDARTHGIFGTGVQAAAHLRAIRQVRPIDKVLVWGRDLAKAEAFAAQHAAAEGIQVAATADPAEAAACAVVSVVTNSPEPVLLGRWLQRGAHLNLVGAHEPEHRETDSDAAAAAAIYVDTRAGALREAGDLLIPMAEGRIDKDAIRGEIGEVLLGKVNGRRDDTEITLYKSLGVFAQDLYAAADLLRSARESATNCQVDFP